MRDVLPDLFYSANMIRHLSYVVCDRCGVNGPAAADAPQARARAENTGFQRRNWNKRIKDVCADCAQPRRAPMIEESE
jgi:Fe2+ or Zn2+ uptake regulation protein